MALDANVASLAVQTTYLTNGINIKKATLDAQVTAAAASATAVGTNATTLGTTATTLATTATTTAAGANTALTAWQSSTRNAEILPAYSVNGFNGTVVASCIYDTSTDSDGGAWRKRCTATSWYNEVTTATGNWLGYFATPLLAVNSRSTSAVGDYYYNITDKLFYSIASITGTPTSATAATGVAIYRGARKEFPEVVAITAEAGRVVIWDLTDSSVPMWMVFIGNGTVNMIGSSPAVVSSLGALNGSLLVGHISWGVADVSFIKDRRLLWYTTPYLYGSNIVNRNSASNHFAISGVGIVNSTANSIAATVLPTSPIDPATGLPIPTIAVGTAGGVSVIKDDGTVVNGANTASMGWVGFVDKQPTTLLIKYSAGSHFYRATDYTSAGFAMPYAYVSPNTGASIPALMNGNNSAGKTKDFALSCGTSGLSYIRENPATLTSGMIANITNTYNTGWMNGDIRLAALADTVVETLAGSNLLTGDSANFNGGTVGSWISGSTYTSTSSAATLELIVTPTVAFGKQVLAIATIIGKTYAVSASVRRVSGTTSSVYITQTDLVGNDIKVFGTTTSATAVTISGYFVATATTSYIGASVSSTADVGGFDNFSVAFAEADRSVKANPLTVIGTLTKSAVNTGSQLVSYSGFSASNYLTQPYSSNLDFGTGDFCIMGWVLSSFAGGNFFERNAPSQQGLGATATYTNSIQAYAQSGNIVCQINGAYRIATGATPTTGSTYLIAFVRQSGIYKLYINNTLAYSVADTGNITNTSHIFTLGTGIAYPTSFCPSPLALFRASATAPSADQIAYIYETERKLFEPGAQCTIQGTSSAVTALDYDQSDDILHVGTPWGVTEFQGLKVNSSYATSVGAVSSISTKSGYELIAGASSVNITAPAKLVRDEINRAGEQKKQFGQDLTYVDFDSVAAQTTFTLPLGLKAKYVYVADVLKRQGSTKDFTITNDGFRDSVVFAVAPGTNIWVSVACTRS